MMTLSCSLAQSALTECLERMDSITEELLAGARALSITDSHHFEYNVSDLLDKSYHYKKNWLLNVLAARQRYERQQVDFNGIQALSMANSQLIKWIIN